MDDLVEGQQVIVGDRSAGPALAQLGGNDHLVSDTPADTSASTTSLLAGRTSAMVHVGHLKM